jgi:hypothetical protein
MKSVVNKVAVLLQEFRTPELKFYFDQILKNPASSLILALAHRSLAV